jgi:hypothetical protein
MEELMPQITYNAALGEDTMLPLRIQFYQSAPADPHTLEDAEYEWSKVELQISENGEPRWINLTESTAINEYLAEELVGGPLWEAFHTDWKSQHEAEWRHE